jgi:hypothetical protein
LAGETLGTSVYEWDDGFGYWIAIVVEFDEVVDHTIEPSKCKDAENRDEELEYDQSSFAR